MSAVRKHHVVQNAELRYTQEKWQAWFEEMEQSLKAENRKSWGLSDDLVAIRQASP